jgi:hypothetical protein
MFSVLGFRRRTKRKGRSMAYGSRRGKGQNIMNKAELIGRLLMVLIGFAVAMLGLIYAIHTQDVYLGILIATGGVMSMLGGLPQ